MQCRYVVPIYSIYDYWHSDAFRFLPIEWCLIKFKLLPDRGVLTCIYQQGDEALIVKSDTVQSSDTLLLV